MKRARKSSPTTKLQEDAKQGTLVQVARLYYEENLSQQEIADKLGVSRSLIALYMQRAHETGIVRVQIFDPTRTCTSLATALKNATRIREITVIPNLRGEQILTLRAVAGAAAAHLANSFKAGDTLGLAWGRTIAAVVNQFQTIPARRIDVIPLMGESGQFGFHSQMNQLVMQAAQNLGAEAHFLSLPMILSSTELRNALVAEAGINDIIAKWKRIDLACLGIGVVPPVPGMVVYIGDEFMPRMIEQGAVGDICGIYYDRDGRILKSGLESRMVAASYEQLQSAGALVAVACGEDKAMAVLGAMRTGLITTLFIDQAMAERILAEFAAETKRIT